MEKSLNEATSGRRSNSWSDLGRAVLIGVLYYAIARVSLTFVVQPEGLAVIWPPSGFVLAVLLLSTKRTWRLTLACVFVANALANLGFGQQVVVSIGFAFVNTLEPLLAASLLLRFVGSPISFHRVRDFVGLGLVGAAVTSFTALLGASFVSWGFDGSPFGTTWIIWWISDGVGMLIVTPFIITFWIQPIALKKIPTARYVEAFLVIASLISVTLLSFLSVSESAGVFQSRYILFPIVGWAALRFGPRGATSAAFLIAVLSVFASIHGFVPFNQIESSAIVSVLALQLYLGVVSLGGGLLSANMAERRRVSNDLEASEKRFRNLFEQSNDAIFIHDNAGHVLDVNERAVEMLGYTHDELLALPIQGYHSPECVDGANSAFRTLQNSGNVQFDSKFRKKDGTIINVALSVRSVESDSPVYQAHVQDITEREQKREQLQFSEERFRAIWNRSFDGMRLTDEFGTIVVVNPAFCRKVGMSREELEGHPLDVIYRSPDGRGIRAATIEQFKVRNIDPHYEHQLTLWDGRTLWFELSNSVVELSSGRQFLLSIFRDISKRKRAENALQLSEEGLRRAQRVAHVGSWTWNIRTNQLEWSDEMYRIFGIDKNSFSGLLSDVITRAIHPEDRSRVEEANLSVINHNKPFPLEYRIIWPDRTLRTVWAEAGDLILDEEGKAHSLSGIVQDITERKHAEEQLELLKHSLDIHSDGAYWFDTNNAFVYVNHEGCKALGYEPQEIIGQSLILVNPEATEEGLQAVWEHLRALGHFSTETTHRRKDGSVFPVEISSTYVRFGGKEYNCGFARDISERKRVERALRENEEKLRLFVEHTPAAVAMFDTEMKYLIASRQWYRDYGLGDQQIIGHSHYEVFTDIPDRWKLIHQRCLAGAVERHEEDPFPRADGHTDWVRWEIHPWRTSGGMIGGIIMFTEVVTDRRLAKEALRESERRYRQFFEEDLTGDFVSTVDGKLLSCNPAFARIYGFHSIEEAMNSNVYELYSSKEARDAFLQLLRQKGKLEYFEEDARRPDGKMLHLVSNIIGVFDDDGELVRIRGYIFDDTERKKLEDQLRYTQKLESIGTLAGGIAHDFNNLLNAVLGQSALALDKLPKESPAGNNVTKAIKAAERAADLTRQLLAYSGKGKFISETIDLNLLIRENLQMLEVSIPKNVQLRLDLGSPPPLIWGDVGQIQQIVMNLIINAGDAIGTKRGYIGLCTSRVEIGQNHGEFERYTRENIPPGPYAMLQVLDTGSGMNEAVLGRIFDPFFTTKFSGRGLGLAAVLGIIRGHQGGMRIRSIEGKGTTFEIIFPTTVIDVRLATPETGNEPVVNGNGETVLVIDDEPFVLEFLRDLFTGANFTALTSSNPLDGIELYRQHREKIALVVLDYSMPEMDGKATFEELVKIDRNVPVVLCSGYTEDEVESVFGATRPTGFIHKPYQPALLLAQVAEILSARKVGA